MKDVAVVLARIKHDVEALRLALGPGDHHNVTVVAEEGLHAVTDRVRRIDATLGKLALGSAFIFDIFALIHLSGQPHEALPQRA